MRTILQALSLLLFSALFVFATYKLPNWVPADIYLRLDPLLGLNAVFAAREIIGRALWTLITIGATVVIGRFFCAYVCPMVISIDFLDVLFFKKKKRPGLKFEVSLRKVKYFLSHHFHHGCYRPPLLSFSHGPHGPSHEILYLLSLSFCDDPYQSHSGFSPAIISRPGMGDVTSPPLSSARFLYVCHHLHHLWRSRFKVQELYSRALNAILAHKVDEAREALEGILAEAPDHIAALLRLGDVFASEDDFQKASTYYQKARMISPQNLETLFAIERNLEKTGRWADALKYIQDILDFDEDNLAAMYRQRVILEKQGRWDELVSVQKAILKHEHTEKDKKSEQQNLIGYEYEYGRHSLESNQLEKAKKAFKAVLRIEKDFIPATLELAEVMLREGESEEAVNLLEKTFEATASKIVLGTSPAPVDG